MIFIRHDPDWLVCDDVFFFCCARLIDHSLAIFSLIFFIIIFFSSFFDRCIFVRTLSGWKVIHTLNTTEHDMHCTFFFFFAPLVVYLIMYAFFRLISFYFFRLLNSFSLFYLLHVQLTWFILLLRCFFFQLFAYSCLLWMKSMEKNVTEEKMKSEYSSCSLPQTQSEILLNKKCWNHWKKNHRIDADLYFAAALLSQNKNTLLILLLLFYW